MKNVLITGYDKDFDIELTAVFAREGYSVYAMGGAAADGIRALPEDINEAAAALKTEAIDIYIDVSDRRDPADVFTVRDGLDEAVIRRLYEANVIRPLALLEAFLPLTGNGEGKRLCWLTSAEASINETRGINGMGYKMAKAGLHNFIQITRNMLAHKGYTFRVFDPVIGEVEPAAAAEAAFNYFTRRRGIEGGDARRDDEDNIVFRDAYGWQHAW